MTCMHHIPMQPVFLFCHFFDGKKAPFLLGFIARQAKIKPLLKNFYAQIAGHKLKMWYSELRRATSSCDNITIYGTRRSSEADREIWEKGPVIFEAKTIKIIKNEVLWGEQSHV